MISEDTQTAYNRARALNGADTWHLLSPGASTKAVYDQLRLLDVERQKFSDTEMTFGRRIDDRHAVTGD